MSQPDAEKARAIIHGPPLDLMEGVDGPLAATIARRAAAAPNGLLRSFRPDGSLREQTFAQTWRRSGGIAAALRAAGIGRGFQVLLLQEDLLDYAPAFWACVRAGAVAVPFTGVAASAAPDELGALLARLERPAILADGPSPGLSRILALLPDAPVLRLDSITESENFEDGGEEADTLCLVPTSGSTGRVKLVMLDRVALAHRYFSRNYAAPGLNDSCLGLFPFDSISGFRALFFHYASWTQMPPRLLSARPAAILETIERFAVTNVQMTNSMAAILADLDGGLAKANLGSLRSVGLGGEAATRAVALRFKALLERLGAGNVLRAGYGATETSPLLVGADPAAAPLDTSGAIVLGGAAAGITLRIVDDAGKPLPEGEAGHVEVHAPKTLFSGYWGEPELSSDSMTAGGFWKTGDLGMIQAGAFSFRGRAKQVLVLGGRKFSLGDIDAHLEADDSIGRRIVSFIVRRDEDATDSLGVAFVLRDGETSDPAKVEAIRASLVRRFGFAPALARGVRKADLPLTATGKIDRAALARQVIDESAAEPAAPDPASDKAGEDARESVLLSLWREAFDLPPDFDRGKSVHELGADSLRIATLLGGIDAKLGRRISLEAFYARPTFDNLLCLAARASEKDAAPSGLWPLPGELHRGLLFHLESWNGRRVTEDRLLLALNENGALPPIFCVFNAAPELTNLAEALGPQQPLYAFRSAHMVGSRDEDDVQRLALRYVQDIQEARPHGPVHLLGQCQGGTIAIAAAQHLARRGRHVPLLVLVDWAMEPVTYDGATLILHGRDSAQNPKFSHLYPDRAWRRMFPNYVAAEIDGFYGELYREDNVRSLAGELARHCWETGRRPAPFLPAEGCEIALSIENMPLRMHAFETARLDVTVTNMGTTAFDSGTTGLQLRNYWAIDGKPINERQTAWTPLPIVAPGASVSLPLVAVAPEAAGDYDFVLDLAEDGYFGIRRVDLGSFSRKATVFNIDAAVRALAENHAATIAALAAHHDAHVRSLRASNDAGIALQAERHFAQIGALVARQEVSQPKAPWFRRLSRSLRKRGPIDLIENSLFFDGHWYRNRYPDVAAAQVDPARHYLRFGYKEGRDPGPCFSTTNYLADNPDIAKTGENPLVHFERYGKYEGRRGFASS